jgi:hypothetical protein
MLGLLFFFGGLYLIVRGITSKPRYYHQRLGEQKKWIPESYEIAVNKYQFGCMPPEHLVDVACHALENGIEGPAIVEIAGMNNPARRDLEEIFPQLMNELGLVSKTMEQSGMIVARDIAEKIIDGETDPISGVGKLASIYNELKFKQELVGFFALNDEYQEVWINKDEFAKYLDNIKTEARVFLKTFDVK